MQKRAFDPGSYAVLIGNPKHAYNDSYLRERVVVKDEFSEHEFEFTFGDPQPIIDQFLQRTGLPFETFGEVIQSRPSGDGTGEALAWFQEHGTYQDTTGVLEDPHATYHTYAPALTFALLEGACGALNNGWEQIQLGRVLAMYEIERKTVNAECVCVRNINTNSMHLLNPPSFDLADGFVGLDGTPTPEMWELATGVTLTHEQVLSSEEKAAFITDVLNHTIIQTNDSLKPYQNPRNVTPEKDTALALSIRLWEREKPNLITSKKALEGDYSCHAGGEIFEHVARYRNFANILSYNGFRDQHLGVVSGSRHYGDEYIEKWGAYAGESITSNDARGTNKSYGEFGDLIYQHLKNQTLQDVLRFGRNTDPTTVYVNTSALPDWVPVKHAEIPALNRNARRVVGYLRKRAEDGDGATINGMVDGTGVNRSFARRVTKDLLARGWIAKHEGIGLNGAHLYEWVHEGS